jgi:DNA-binding LacI/PurR family transcriptional regulator
MQGVRKSWRARHLDSQRIDRYTRDEPLSYNGVNNGVNNGGEGAFLVARAAHRTTIRDVAAHAGVSFKSVSNVVNDRPYVSEDLRTRVQRAIDDLGYRPHSIARSLASRRSDHLGIVVRASATESHADPFLSQVLLGACAIAGAHGFGMLVQVLLSEEPIVRYADIFDHRQVDGVILFSPRIDDGPDTDEKAAHDLPAVRIGRAAAGTNAMAVDGDDEQGAFTAVSHLAALGHKRIGMVANAAISYTVSATRIHGYKRALATHGLEGDDTLLTSGHFTVQSGYDGMARLLDLQEPPTAVFVSSDRMALGAMRAAADRGFHIPEDVAIVGYDDLFIGEFLTPRLTTVRAPIDAISSRATEMLIAAVRGQHVDPRQVIFPTELVVRQSCGAKPAVVFSRSS